MNAFIEHGFDGVTMEDIARDAGVGKPTLYARYDDKHSLFQAVIPWALQNLNWLDPLDGHEGEGSDDLAQSLLATARAAHARAIAPATVGLIRMVMAESPRFPDIALSSDELLRSPLIGSVADLLRRHEKELRTTDVHAAAEIFIGMVHVVPLLYASFGFRRPKKAVETNLTLIVSMFLDGLRATP